MNDAQRPQTEIEAARDAARFPINPNSAMYAKLTACLIERGFSYVHPDLRDGGEGCISYDNQDGKIETLLGVRVEGDSFLVNMDAPVSKELDGLLEALLFKGVPVVDPSL